MFFASQDEKKNILYSQSENSHKDWKVLEALQTGFIFWNLI